NRFLLRECGSGKQQHGHQEHQPAVNAVFGFECHSALTLLYYNPSNSSQLATNFSETSSPWSLLAPWSFTLNYCLQCLSVSATSSVVSNVNLPSAFLCVTPCLRASVVDPVSALLSCVSRDDDRISR